MFQVFGVLVTSWGLGQSYDIERAFVSPELLIQVNIVAFNGHPATNQNPVFILTMVYVVIMAVILSLESLLVYAVVHVCFKSF